MLLEPIMLPIYFFTDDTKSKDEQGVPYKMTENSIRNVAFYHISLIHPSVDKDDNNKLYTTIVESGNTYACSLSPIEVRNKIDSHLKYLNEKFRNKESSSTE